MMKQITQKNWGLLVLSSFMLMLVGCNDEPELSYSVEVRMYPSYGNVQRNGDHFVCEVNGLAQGMRVSIKGEYDTFESNGEKGDWFYLVDYSSFSSVAVPFDRFFGENQSRSFAFEIKVASGGSTKTYYFTVIQHSVSPSELLSLEPKALEYYLSDKIVKDVPYDYNYLAYNQVKEYAPYYRISSNPEVYMQLQSKGNAGYYNPGDPINIEYEVSLNLTLDYYFSLNSSPFVAKRVSKEILQNEYGPGLILPLDFQLPLGSTVKLILPNSVQPPLEAADHMLYEFIVTYN